MADSLYSNIRPTTQRLRNPEPHRNESRKKSEGHETWCARVIGRKKFADRRRKFPLTLFASSVCFVSRGAFFYGTTVETGSVRKFSVLYHPEAAAAAAFKVTGHSLTHLLPLPPGLICCCFQWHNLGDLLSLLLLISLAKSAKKAKRVRVGEGFGLSYNQCRLLCGVLTSVGGRTVGDFAACDCSNFGGLDCIG